MGEFSNPDGEVLELGQKFRLDLDPAKGDNTRVQLPHPEIIQASEVGHNLLIDDGKVKFTVSAKGPDYLECTVDVAGRVKDRKGVNTPDSVLDISPLTPKDRSDLEYMLSIGVDWVALSFVQTPADIDEIHALIDVMLPTGAFRPAVMAKIEKPSCFLDDNLEQIVEKCNGIMVARGDVRCFFVCRALLLVVFLLSVSLNCTFPPFHIATAWRRMSTRRCPTLAETNH